MQRFWKFAVVIALAAMLSPAIARTAPSAPTGLTAMALDGKVSLAWKTSSGATSYKIFRGTTAGAITTQIGTSTTTTYTDATSVNNSTYYYAVKAVSNGDSGASNAAKVKPVAASCSTGSAIVVENCFPGTTAWRATAAGPVSASISNIEGFASVDSVNQGGSFDVKINTADNAPYHIDIYRMGWYGGSHSRLVSTIPSLVGVNQPDCQEGSGNTGLVDCSNWSVAATVTTSTSWQSGVYMLRLVRDDTGTDNNVLITVRKDGSTSDVLFGVPTATYEAYNNYGDRSLYDFNSQGSNTVAGTPRAVKVSYDRPYMQTAFPDPNWFGTYDVASVGFLEHNGYDVTYVTSSDLHTSGSQVANHKSFVSPTHDEYWSSEMRNGVTSARNAGTGLFWMGSNQVYWKIRYENNPFSGGSTRIVACYKSTQSGATDPVSPTGTWRDPAGANAPENALVGQMYIGDNDQNSFKLQVNDTQGKNRVWRHTDLGSLASGASTQLGRALVGWEWNDRVNNGQEPAGVQTFSASPVTGELVQNNGRNYITGQPAAPTGTIYKASSGAYVVSTGTNLWMRGLDLDGTGDGELNPYIQQATVNILSDMRSLPSTPMAGLVVDATGAPTVTSRTPTAGATGVPTDAPITVTFDKNLDPASVTTTTAALTTQAGSAVPAAVTYDDSSKTVTIDPTQPLGGNAVYRVTLKGGASGIAAWGGSLAADDTWTFTTGTGTPPVVMSTTPANGTSDVSVATTVKATFDRDMQASSLTTSSFTLTPQLGNAVAATVTYDAASDTATLTPSAALDPTRTYTAALTTAVKGADGTSLAAAKTWTFTTADALSVTSKTPAASATGVSPGAIVRAVFSRGIDPTSLTSATFNLTPAGGSAITATLSYDATTRAATLTPSAQLALNKVYTVKVGANLKAADGVPMGTDVTWTFTTATSAPTAPTVAATSPAASATNVPTDSTVTATFDRAMDATSITGATFLVRDASNATVAGTVTYDSASQTARFTPTAALAPGVKFTAQLTTGVRAADGTPMATATSWQFTTADCPCSLMSGLTPTLVHLDVQDGRAGSGLTYELGTKIQVTKTMKLTSIKFYKDTQETGTHVGRVWSSSGTLLGSATFSNESASGWQKATLSAPISLAANTTYTVSVGFNTRFAMTTSGLSAALTVGPLTSVADGLNGVYGGSAGTFPTNSWSSSNYFVDAVVTNPSSANTPSVSTRSPASGATNVDPGTTVTATFGSGMDASTINSSNFELRTSGGTLVPASVTYDETSRTATLTPNSQLALGASYTAKLLTGIRSDDATALPAAVSWSFSTATSIAPSVTSTSPANGATNVGTGQPVSAVFSSSLDPTTVTGSSFTLSSSGGAVAGTVSYDDASKTAKLTPAAALAANTTYTATITTAVKNTQGKPMAANKTWTFTTSACPCQLMASTLTPAYTGLDVRDGRPAPGPWSYELGTKISVSAPTSLTAIRFYKDAGETGTHTGTLWTATGTQIAQVTFTGETASGWQQQALATPVTLTPGVTYVVSVGFNARFVTTVGGFNSQMTSGPLSSVADGANGVFGGSAGVFPTGSWNNSNYFVDAVVA
jgi:hypothetical protein